MFKRNMSYFPRISIILNKNLWSTFKWQRQFIIVRYVIALNAKWNSLSRASKAWTYGLKFNKSVVSCLKNSITTAGQTEGMFKSRSKSQTAVQTGCVLHPCFGVQARAGCHGSAGRRQRDRCRADDRSTLLSIKKKFTHFNENIYISYFFLNKKKDNAHRLFISFECIQIRLWTKGLHIRLIVNFYEVGT